MQSNCCVYIVHINACGKANKSAQVVFIKWDEMLPVPDYYIYIYFNLFHLCTLLALKMKQLQYCRSLLSLTKNVSSV